MRKINKSAAIPQTLQTAPVPNSAASVQESIYKAPDVRKRLCEDQDYKCAYCESSITLKYNDVEHYRPKSQYYWLGHDWHNLLYSCTLCNRSYKKSQFPLIDETQRVSTPGSIDREHPLILNPAEVDPADHIAFRRHMMVGLTPEGSKTIEVLHLNDTVNRQELVSEREQLYEVYQIEKHKIDNAKAILSASNLPADVAEGLRLAVQLSERSIARMKSRKKAHSGMLLSQI